MYTIYKVNDADWIPQVLDFLNYEMPLEEGYKVSSKLIWDNRFEEEELFWESLGNFLKEFRSCKEYTIEWLPGVYYLEEGVPITLEKIVLGNIQLIDIREPEDYSVQFPA